MKTTLTILVSELSPLPKIHVVWCWKFMSDSQLLFIKLHRWLNHIKTMCRGKMEHNSGNFGFWISLFGIGSWNFSDKFVLRRRSFIMLFSLSLRTTTLCSIVWYKVHQVGASVAHGYLPSLNKKVWYFSDFSMKTWALFRSMHSKCFCGEILYLLKVFGQTCLSKKCRRRWNATECGVSPGSTLFASHPAIYRYNRLYIVHVQFLEQVW